MSFNIRNSNYVFFWNSVWIGWIFLFVHIFGLFIFSCSLFVIWKMRIYPNVQILFFIIVLLTSFYVSLLFFSDFFIEFVKIQKQLVKLLFYSVHSLDAVDFDVLEDIFLYIWYICSLSMFLAIICFFLIILLTMYALIIWIFIEFSYETAVFFFFFLLMIFCFPDLFVPIIIFFLLFLFCCSLVYWFLLIAIQLNRNEIKYNRYGLNFFLGVLLYSIFFFFVLLSIFVLCLATITLSM